MARITPNNRGETIAAWGLGLVGGAYAAFEFGREVVEDAISNTRRNVAVTAGESAIEHTARLIPLHNEHANVSTEASILSVRKAA